MKRKTIMEDLRERVNKDKQNRPRETLDSRQTKVVVFLSVIVIIIILLAFKAGLSLSRHAGWLG